MAMEPMQGKWASSQVDLGYTELFGIPELASVFSSVIVFLGTLWSSIKQIEAPYRFDREHGIPLHTMQGNRGSVHGKGEVSWVLLSCGRTWGIFSSYGRDGHSKLEFVQLSQDSCPVTTDNSGI